MKETPRRRSTAFLLLVLFLLAACTPPATVSPPEVVRLDNQESRPSPRTAIAADEGEGAAEGAAAGMVPAPGTAVPVSPSDPVWGDALAPVTLVIWGDFECPFTSKLMANLPELQRQYGPEKLRIVWKHFPLPFHRNARPAHLAAETVLRLGGSKAFWRFHGLAFGNQRLLGTSPFGGWAAESGVDPAAFEEAFASQRHASAIEDDITLGRRAGVTGTPASFVNGVFLAGAQPIERFQATIDEQLAAAAALKRAGVPADRIYADLSDRNHKMPPPKVDAPVADTTTVWKVPVDGSPVRGNKAALVTLVMFGDFQCPFCKRSLATIAELEGIYGDKLRVVFKHNPLPMHPRAEPAAELAIEAGAQKGEVMFWRAFQALYDSQDHLEDADLEGIALSLGLDVKRTKKAITSRAHAARIERDQFLTDELEAGGTPHFFINGRRLVGSQVRQKFDVIIDEEIKKAEKLVAEGTPPAKIYDALQKDAKSKPMVRILAPAATKDNPGKGAPLGAPVTIQMFADFQCPFCKRVQAQVDEIVAAHPGKVRVVWRHLPLAFHAQARMAAEASVEAFRQKGEAGFWAFSARLFEDQTQGLDRAGIERKAAEVGLDVAKLSAALDARTHWKVVQADAELAERLKITGTPGFVINDYFVSGAQPLLTFKRFIDRALKSREPIVPAALKADARQPVPLALSSPPPFVTPAPLPVPGAVQPGQQLGAKHLIVMYAGSKRAPAHVTRTRDEAKARAEEARKRLLGGATFTDVVAQYSDEPGAGSRGGDLGTFPRGAMIKEFQDAVDQLQVGETSGVVETPFGFHIIVRTR